MERLVAAFPTDREAQVLYGVSLLGLSQGVRDVPTYLRAAAIAQRVFRDNPNHPGAAHLLIHCYDDATHAALGLSAARAYSRIAPDAPHAQHMPTHIFLALGMWDEVVSQNELASGRDRANWEPNHYTQWLGYGYLQQGRYDTAQRHLELMRRNAEKGMRGRAVLAQMRAEYVVNSERWDCPCLRWDIDLTAVRARDAAVDLFTTGLSRRRATNETRSRTSLSWSCRHCCGRRAARPTRRCVSCARPRSSRTGCRPSSGRRPT